MGIGDFAKSVGGAVANAADAAVDKTVDVAQDVAGEVTDAVVTVGETAYNVSKEFADKVVEMAQYVMGFTDEAVEKVIKLLGLPWPKADEGRMRELATAYTVFADAIESVQASTGKQMASVVANNKGPTIDAMAEFWRKYDAGGGAGALPVSAAACRAQAKLLNEAARLVTDAKDTMRTEILAVAATILAGVGLSVVTAGAASGAAASASAAVVSACGAAAGTLLAGIVTAVVTAGVYALQGALVAIVVDLAVTQPVRLAGGALDGYNLDHVTQAALYGGAGGAAGSMFATTASQLPKIAPALESFSPTLATTARNAPRVVTSLPGQAVTGAGGAALINTATGKPITLADLAFGAAGGAAGARATKAMPTQRSPTVPDSSTGTIPPDRAIQIKSNYSARPGGISPTGSCPPSPRRFTAVFAATRFPRSPACPHRWLAVRSTSST